MKKLIVPISFFLFAVLCVIVAVMVQNAWTFVLAGIAMVCGTIAGWTADTSDW